VTIDIIRRDTLAAGRHVPSPLTTTRRPAPEPPPPEPPVITPLRVVPQADAPGSEPAETRLQ